MNTLGVYMNAQLDAGEEDLQLQIAHLHARLKIARHISCNKMSKQSLHSPRMTGRRT